MPRPRFYKLSEEKRQGILTVARAEFAESGFEGASYNQIIEKAGLSKGAMYYYFDDKIDLYAAVLEDVEREMIESLGPLSLEGEFWEVLERLFRKSIQFAIDRPELASLARGLRDVRHLREGPIAGIYARIMEMTGMIIAHGQAVGAVRTDLPQSLLVSVGFAMGEAIDFWMIDQFGQFAVDEDVDRTVTMLIGLWRDLLAPKEQG